MAWMSADLVSTMGTLLLQNAGITSSLQETETTRSLEAVQLLREGKGDWISECWDTETKCSDNGAFRVGEVGYPAEEGLFIPRYLATARPDLTELKGWQGNEALLGGQVLVGPWIHDTISAALAQENVNATLAVLKTENDLIYGITQRLRHEEPVMFYMYGPSSYLATNDFVKVKTDPTNKKTGEPVFQNRPLYKVYGPRVSSSQQAYDILHNQVIMSNDESRWIFNAMAARVSMKRQPGSPAYVNAMTIAVKRFLCEIRRLRSFCDLTTAELATRNSAWPENIRVGFKPCEPFVFCTPGQTTYIAPGQSLPSTIPEFSGFTVDLWKALAPKLGYTPADYEMYCGATTPGIINDTIKDLADIAGACITITAARTERSDFTYQYYRSGLSLLVKSSTASSHSDKSVWWMFDTMTFPVWLGLASATVVTGALVSLFEQTDGGTGGRWPKKLQESWERGVYMLFTALLLTPMVSLASAASRMLLVIFMFCAFCCLALFTGNITAMLTINRATLPLSSVDDFNMNTRVGVLCGTDGANKIEKLRPESQITCSATLAPLIKDLEVGNLDVVVHDAPTLKYTSQLNPAVVPVGNVFEPQEYGLVLGFDSPFTQDLNIALQSLKDSGVLDGLDARHFSGPTTSTSSTTTAKGKAVEPSDVVGLLIILLIGAALSVLVWGVPLFYRWKTGQIPNPFVAPPKDHGHHHGCPASASKPEQEKVVLKSRHGAFAAQNGELSPFFPNGEHSPFAQNGALAPSPVGNGGWSPVMNGDTGSHFDKPPVGGLGFVDLKTSEHPEDVEAKRDRRLFSELEDVVC